MDNYHRYEALKAEWIAKTQTQHLTNTKKLLCGLPPSVVFDMAGDWIKMRSDLQTSPKVVRISSATKADRLRVVGALHAVWSIFDTHAVDGILEGYTLEVLDSLIGFDGFSEQMSTVEWLVVSGDSLSMPRYDAHNGKSAKKRAMDSERKRKARDVPDMSASQPDKSATREEKRREDSKDTSSSDDKAVKIDYEGIVELFNKTLPSLPRVLTISPKRRAAMKTCSTTKPKYSSLEFWEYYFKHVSNSDFLMGRESNWKADFDFLIKHSQFIKLLKGGITNEYRATKQRRG